MRWFRAWTRKQQILAAAALLLAAGGVLTWLLWPTPKTDAPRERQYRSTTACLLTDDKGISSDPASAAWAGMQDASTATQIKVQYLSIAGPQTAANGLSFFNSLGVQKCTVIVAAGPTPVAAMVEGYTQFPGVRLVAVAGDTKGTPITAIDGSPAAIQSGVRAIVAAAA